MQRLAWILAALLPFTADGQQPPPGSSSTNTPTINLPLQPYSPTIATPQPNTVTIPSAITPIDPNNPSPQPTQPSTIRAKPYTPLDPREQVIGVVRPKPIKLPEPATPSNILTDAPPPSTGAALPLRQTVHYVSVGGSDENAGTALKPLRTIQQAANLAQPGDTVFVNNGIHRGFRTVRPGTAESKITFKAGGDNVIIGSPTDNATDNILIQGTDHIVIEGFIVQKAPRAGMAVIGADDCVIRGNHIIENADTGLLLAGDCRIGGEGVLQRALVENNTFQGNAGKGLSLQSVQSSRIQNNLFHDHGREEGVAGIHITALPDCDKPSADNVIVNNTIAEPNTTGIHLTADTTGNVVFNNIVVSKQPVLADNDKNEVDTDSNITTDDASSVFRAAVTGDFHLAGTAPGRATGRAALGKYSAPATDISGRLRPVTAISVGAFQAEGLGVVTPPTVVRD
jgi:parallel beta-helix repeat protein